MKNKKKQRKIYVVGGDNVYANWCEGVVVNSMKNADLVIFTGGEDVDPRFYGKRPHPTTSSNPARDVREINEFEIAKQMGLPMLGICRGSQFLCVMAGGILVQHQSHPSHHLINVHGEFADKQIMVTSSHHQRQFPWAVPCEIYGWCNLSPFSLGQDDSDDMSKIGIGNQKEVEIAYYPEINALAIQSHPEWAYPAELDWKKAYIAHCRYLLDRLMTGAL